MTDFHFANTAFHFAYYIFWVHFASKRFQIHFVQIVLQITVGPCDNRIRKKNNDDDKEETKARLGQAACKCQTQTLESYRSCASKHPKFWVLEVCPHLLVISSYYLMQSLAELLFGSASLLQLSCVDQAVLPISFLCVHHLAECLSPTNNFSLSYPDFWEVFSHFITRALYSLYQWKQLCT